MRVRCVLAIVCLLLVAAEAGAHGPAPAALGVLSAGGQRPGGLEGDDARPDVVRTNLGLALARADGTYTYGCPSQWGGSEQGFGAALPDRTLIVMLGKGRVYASIDGGCQYDELGLPDGVGYAAEAVAWRGRVWVVTRSGEGGAVVSVGPAADLREERRWGAEGGEPWTPDMAFAADEGAPELLVTGARPAAAVWALGEDGGWSRLEGLPDAPELQRLEVAEVAPAGELWLKASLPAGRQLWRARLDAGRLTVAPEPLHHQVLHGPVLLDGQLVAARDGRLAVTPALGPAGSLDAPAAWTEHGEVAWTCLQRRGPFVYACTLPALLQVEALDGGEVPTRPVWRLAQLGGPVEGCPPAASEATVCELDWFHYGGEAGLTARAPVATPSDAPAPPPPAPDAGCRGGAMAGWGALGGLLALISRGWRPRARRGAS